MFHGPGRATVTGQGVAGRSAYTASLLGQIEGPVLLAGHSRGGAVITSAAASAPNAAGLPAEQTALMAATQRPVAAAAFSDACGPPAWRRLPSWAVVASGDKAAVAGAHS